MLQDAHIFVIQSGREGTKSLNCMTFATWSPSKSAFHPQNAARSQSLSNLARWHEQHTQWHPPSRRWRRASSRTWPRSRRPPRTTTGASCRGCGTARGHTSRISTALANGGGWEQRRRNVTNFVMKERRCFRYETSMFVSVLWTVRRAYQWMKSMKVCTLNV